jgi:DNA gyrase subunit A
LADRQKVLTIIKDELLELKNRFGDARVTKIIPDEGDMSMEDLTPNDEMAVFITEKGYIKRVPLDTFERQNRATRGKGAMKTREEDDVTHFFTAGMHNHLLFFTSRGVAHSLKVYELPEGSRQSKGLALINLLPLEQDERITAVVPVIEFGDNAYLVMLTKYGWIKRIELSNFENIRRNGLIAINLEEGDVLNWVKIAEESHTVFISTKMGMAIRFQASDLRPMGRTARGVTSMKLRTGDEICSFSMLPADTLEDATEILFITNDGYGKLVRASEFRKQARGGIGLISTKFKNRDSRLSSTCTVNHTHELMIATANGVVVRMAASSISQQGRQATGVRIVNLDAGDTVANVTKIVNLHSEDPEEDASAEG